LGGRWGNAKEGWEGVKSGTRAGGKDNGNKQTGVSEMRGGHKVNSPEEIRKALGIRNYRLGTQKESGPSETNLTQWMKDSRTWSQDLDQFAKEQAPLQVKERKQSLYLKIIYNTKVVVAK
jgi:hypothetical protein